MRKKEDFNQVFRSGKAIFFNELGLKYSINHSKNLRLGFTFSKKYLPLATQRNRLRRLLSEAFFQLKNEWPTGVDIVIFAAKKAQKVDSPTSLAAIKHFLKRIKENQKNL